MTFDVEPRMLPEDGLLQLPGNDAKWIWAFICSVPGCDCRAATIIATAGDRDALLARGAPVRDAWLAQTGHAAAAAKLEGVTGFSLEIDAAVAFGFDDEEPLDLEANPAVREIVDRLDGDVLDAIDRLWHLGKGSPDPEAGAAARIEVEGWRPGDGVDWNDAFPGARRDIYEGEERAFEALDVYCVERDCDCDEVSVDFMPLGQGRGERPGMVGVVGGEVQFAPEHPHRLAQLERLWSAFLARHPRYVERFARRRAVMHGLAGRVFAAAAKVKVKVGRNDQCPCGSGRKYKKCCGAALFAITSRRTRMPREAAPHGAMTNLAPGLQCTCPGVNPPG